MMNKHGWILKVQEIDKLEFAGENVDEKVCKNKYFPNYHRSYIHNILFYCSERILYIHKFLLLFNIGNILLV